MHCGCEVRARRDGVVGRTDGGSFEDAEAERQGVDVFTARLVMGGALDVSRQQRCHKSSEAESSGDREAARCIMASGAMGADGSGGGCGGDGG